MTNARPPRRTRLALCLALAVAAAAPARAQGPFTSLTVFGDSYVDSGNLRRITFGTQPPPSLYPSGRLSDGDVFSEYLARSLGRPGDAAPVFGTGAASGNYAVGGARTDGAFPPGTQTQIGAYLTRPGAGPGTFTDPTGLYLLFAGGNDLREAGGIADPVARQAAAAAAAGRVVAQAGLLAGAGARNVLVFTLPSLGVTPEAQRNPDPGRPAALDQATAAFNATLAAGIAGLQTAAPAATFFNFRLDNLLANILADARAGGALYGLTNVTAPCLPGFNPGPASCDVSLFSDQLHPTTRTHQVIAASVYGYVTTGQNVAVIPEPATPALVAGGLAALGAARARRAASRRRAA